LARFEAAGDDPSARRSGAHVTQLFEDHCREAAIAPLERRLAQELVYGVVRRRATLDAVLQPFVARPRENVEPGLWRLLRLGAYQLTLLTSIPPHAAVDETVSLARRIGQPRWAGFLNGVLRSVARDLMEEAIGPPAADAVPLGEEFVAPGMLRQRRLARPIFPDPIADPAGYLTQALSFPTWLVDRWLARLGWNETLRIAVWLNTPGRMALRVNRRRATREQALERLAQAGIDPAPGTEPDCVRLARPARVEELPGFEQGDFSVQDESAQAAAAWLDPQPGERLLDLCAAPGGKTTHLAERMGDAGRIIAVDVQPERLARIAAACARLGLRSIETCLCAADDSAPAGPDIVPLPEGPFDAALVDVPCSNTGVLGKRPDARWRIAPRDLEELPALQARLLRAALQRVRPGGRVLYSTCSIEPEENAAVVQSVLATTPDWRVEQERSALPGAPADGGYLALLRRTIAAGA